MEFGILGPLEVREGVRLVGLPTGRGRALLALLVLHAGEVVSADRIVAELWPDPPPPSVTAALQNLVSRLRGVLEPARGSRDPPSVLQTRPPGYVLAVDPAQVDADRFARLLDGAAGLPAPDRAGQLRRALRLWRGPALADFAYDPFAQTAIARLEELRVVAVEERVDADLALGRHAELVAELEGLVAQHPLRERLRGQLMVALYGSGRQAEALQVYRDGHRALVEDLGIEPGPALQRLEQAILDHDPMLEAKPAPVLLDVAAVIPTASAQPGLPEGRRPATIVCIDLGESVSARPRLESVDAPPVLDPEALSRIVGRYCAEVSAVLHRHGGTAERLAGDAVMGVFGVPAVHEDDAVRAVRAADELRRALAVLNEDLERSSGMRLSARIGIDTGEVVVGSAAGQPLVSGSAVNLAARLQQAASDGEVLVAEATRRLVRDAALLEPVEDEGVEGRPGTAAWRLLGLVPGAPAVSRRLDAAMVGRTGELALLQESFDRCVRERRGVLCTVLGEAGIGKSRLAVEFAHTLGSHAARSLTGHCPAYGDGLTFRPLREVLLQAAGRPGREGLEDLLAGEDDAEWVAAHLAGPLGLTAEAGRPDELFPAVRRLLEALARKQPVVVVLEDVHWAEPTLLDLVEYLAEWTREPVLLLCMARPELLETRPASADSGPGRATLRLSPLAREDAEKLIADRLAGRTLPPDTVARVLATAEGNPLFLEQLLAALEWEEDLPVPPSLHALLAARLDRLGPAERSLLRCAAVIGTEFSAGALPALLPEQAGPSAGRHLEALERRELIRPSPERRPGQAAFVFRHGLIQLVAYQSMTRHARARLHERLADWLDDDVGHVPDLDETVGYHLERAHHERREAGLLDAHGRALAVRAGERLARAGLRAYERYDVAATENLLARGGTLLPHDHPQRAPTLRILAEAHQALGRHHDADAVLAELLAEVHPGDHLLEQTIRLERARIRVFTGPDPTTEAAVHQEVERALAVFGSAADDAGLARALFVLSDLHQRGGHPRLMEDAARRGLAHADRSGHLREVGASQWMLAWALVAGPVPVPECIRECERLSRWRDMEHPGVLCDLAHLRAMAGEFDEARSIVGRARRLMVERLRVRRPLMFAARSAGAVEILAGDPAAAERELGAALEQAVEMGERDVVAQVAAVLGRLLFTHGDPAEGERLAALGMDRAPAGSVPAQALCRAAHARSLAHRGDHVQAERTAHGAVRLVPADMLDLRADLLTDLADVLLARGARDEAEPVVADAVECYERKGNLVSASRARSFVSRLTE